MKYALAFFLCCCCFLTASAITVTLDASLKENDPENGLYNNAIDAFAAIDGSEWAHLTVRPGVYWLDDPDSDSTAMPKDGRTIPYAVEVTCNSLLIEGTDPDARATVFAVNRGQTQGAIGNFTMFHFLGSELEAKNITFGNFCNVDLIYPRNPALNRAKRNPAIVQAQIGICELPGQSGKWGDYGSGTEAVSFINCRFISRLNLCPFVGARMSFYTDCYFECTDDALTGTAIYRNCTFKFFSSKPFYSTSPTGAVFVNCDIDIMTDGVQYLTKVPGMVTLVDTRFHSKSGDGNAEIRWTRDPSAIVCYQSGVTLDGKPYNVDADRPQLWAKYPKNLTGGSMLRLAPDELKLKAVGDTASLSLELVLWGGTLSKLPPRIVKWEFPDFVTMTDDGKIVSANRFPEPMTGVIYATSATGYRGGLKVSVDPLLTDAPNFSETPTISCDKPGKNLTINYILDSDNTDDRSTVTWLRGTSADDPSPVAILHGPVSRLHTYPLSRADKGMYISARVEPQVYGSHIGEAVMTQYEQPISMRHTATLTSDQKRYETDFSLIPVENRTLPLKGAWMLDAFKPADTAEYDWEVDNGRNAWYYGRGQDGAAIAEGFVQAVRGARALYIPDRDKCRSVTLDYLLYPAKPAGQGFGSATGQYMDFYFMFDPEHLNGYSLRVERTPDHDRAVVCRFMKITAGKSETISESVATTAFRSPCHISITAADGLANARLYSESTEGEITLSAPIGKETHAPAIGFQHTGTTGGASTLIKSMKAEWK